MKLLTPTGRPLQEDVHALFGEGCTLTLADHPSTFEVAARFCENPDCDCSHLSLYLTERPPFDDRTALMARVDLELDGEDEPPRSRLARALQKGLTPQLRADLLAEIQSWRRDWYSLSEVPVPEGWRPEGVRIPFSSLKAGGDIELDTIAGGLAFLSTEDGEWIVHDLYCADPHCDCSEVQLSFFEAEPGSGELTGRDFSVELDVDTGMSTLRIAEGEDEGLALALLEELLKTSRYFNQFKRRMAEAKRFGARAIAAYKTRLHKKTRSSRNAPCPCGSGKKLKSCCGRKR